MKMRSVILSVMFAVGIVQCTQANLIVNGGFETGDFSGWTMSGNLGFAAITSIPSDVHTGAYAASFGAYGSQTLLSQTITTTPGTAYTLDFWLLNGEGTPNLFTVNWNGSQLENLANANSFGYTEYTFNAAATTSATLLEFGFQQDVAYWGFDDVSLNPTTGVPDGGATLGLLAISLVGLAFLRRRAACAV